MGKEEKKGVKGDPWVLDLGHKEKCYKANTNGKVKERSRFGI